MHEAETAVPRDGTDRGGICPHLGLEGDPATYCLQPSPWHRCYLWMQRGRIDLAHQENFCLADCHSVCPWLSVDGQPTTRADNGVFILWGGVRPVIASASRRAAAVAAALWVLLCQFLMWLGHLAAHLAAAAWRWLPPAIGRSLRFLGSHARLRLIGLGASAMRQIGRIVGRRGAPAGEGMDVLLAPAAPVDRLDAAAVKEDSAESREAAKLVKRGILALREGGREAAYALFVRATELAPGYEDGWLWRSALLESAEEKHECLEQLLRANPSSGFAATALALLDRPLPTVLPAAGPSTGAPGAAAASARATDSAEPSTHATAAIWQCSACESTNTGPSRACRTCGHPSPETEEELMSTGDALLERGLVGLKAGNEELAHVYFVMACKASPNNELAWNWRAKTAPTLDEVIDCLQRMLEINPGSAKTRADLKSAMRRREREQMSATPRPQRSTAAAPQRREVSRLRGAVGELRWWLLQLAGLCAFLVALALTLPYVLRLAGPPSRPELETYLALLPGIQLPELAVRAPGLPAFDIGPALPLVLGLLLLHAAFVVISGGVATRAWTLLLAALAGGLTLHFGADTTASWYIAGLAALASAGAVAGSAPPDRVHRYEPPSTVWRSR